MPTIYVIAGPNGVGKTTFADRYLPDEARQLEFINADLIARGIAPYQPDQATMDAGRIALGRIRALLAQRVGFTWETTMSGRTAVNWLRGAKAAGFEIKACFLWVRRVEVTIRGHSLQSLQGELGGFGAGVEILGPRELREGLARVGQELIALYG